MGCHVHVTGTGVTHTVSIGYHLLTNLVKDVLQEKGAWRNPQRLAGFLAIELGKYPSFSIYSWVYNPEFLITLDTSLEIVYLQLLRDPEYIDPHTSRTIHEVRRYTFEQFIVMDAGKLHFNKTG